MTSAESTALGLAVGLGIVAILTGFFGLVTLYRRESAAHIPSTSPPVRRIAPVGEKRQAPAEAVATEPAAPAGPAPSTEPSASPTPVASEAEPAPEAMLELSAPVEPLELPAVGTADPGEVAAPATQRKPRRRRTPRPPSSPAAPTEGAD
jgi:hypothetical protein